MIANTEVSHDLLKNTVVFLSNSTLDGFREGDGDLMDKLTYSLNTHHHVQAIRIIQNDLNIPDDKKDLLEKKQLICLSHTMVKTLPNIPQLQENLLKIVQQKEYHDKHKIFYIGSRLRATAMTTQNSKGVKIFTGEIKLGESGSLFDSDFIQTLKGLNIKIVICALEYQFFRRSVGEMERCYQTLKQHFFQADKIHFLTQSDKRFFEETLEALETTSLLPPLPLALEGYEYAKKRAETEMQALTQEEAPLLRTIQLLKNKLEANQNAKDKILTTQEPNVAKKLTETDRIKLGEISQQRKDLLNELKELEKKHSEEEQERQIRQKEFLKKLEILEMAYSRLKEFHFQGIEKKQWDIHKKKGVFISGIYTVDPLTPEEIMTLAPEVGLEASLPFKQILAQRSCNILQFGMIRGEKGIDEAISLGLLFQAQGDPHKVIIAGKLMLDLLIVKSIFLRIFGIDGKSFMESLGKAIGLPEGQRLPRSTQEAEKLIETNGVITKFNTFCGKLYQELKAKYSERGKNIEVYFDVEENKLRQLALRCKYAMKFDHKGMANNASTIASCLGFYLPTFTTCGLVTDPDFENIELGSSSANPTSKYLGVTIMPKAEWMTAEEAMGEIKPQNPPIQEIYEFIKHETPETYKQRIEQLEKLHSDKVFDTQRVAGQLKEEILIPLLENNNKKHTVDDKSLQTSEEGSTASMLEILSSKNVPAEDNQLNPSPGTPFSSFNLLSQQSMKEETKAEVPKKDIPKNQQ